MTTAAISIREPLNINDSDPEKICTRMCTVTMHIPVVSSSRECFIGDVGIVSLKQILGEIERQLTGISG